MLVRVLNAVKVSEITLKVVPNGPTQPKIRAKIQLPVVIVGKQMSR